MRIYVTGSLAVAAEGVVAREGDLPGQARLVLAMLAVEHRRPLSRDELADELWPERLPGSWETALRAVVSKLRAALATAGIPAERLIGSSFGCYELRLPRGAWIDLDAAADALHLAEAQLERGELEPARANATVTSIVCARPFLAGVYSPWAVATRSRIGTLRVRAAECLAEAWAASGDGARAARAAEQALALDPFRETTVRRLIAAYALLGDRAAAANAYRRCRELLARDLGVAPAPETVALYRAVAG